MGGILTNVSLVSAATMASRVLGLLRDILLFALLGVGAVNSAFILAFTLPNLFRRLLGEGALTSAFIPVLAEAVEREGREAGHALLNAVLVRLAVVLGMIVILGWVLLIPMHALDGLADRFHLGATFSAILLPYVVLICLAAMLGAALNVERRFLWPALSAVWLNLAMIGALAAGAFLPEGETQRRALWLCAGVLFGGGLQLVVPALDLARRGWRPSPRGERSPRLGRVFALLVPGLLGAAIFQINILVSRLLAFSLDDDASAILYLSARLVELPLGVFAIAVSTVLFPEMARLRARVDDGGLARTYGAGLRMVFLITVPAAVGLAVLAEPILHLLFAWGRFGGAEVAATQWPLVISACGIPFYAWMGLSVRGFHAFQDMKTPVRLGAFNLVVNLVLSLVLMGPFGVSGLALANVVSSGLHAVLLEISLRRRLKPMEPRRRVHATILGAASAMGLMVWCGDAWMRGTFDAEKLDAFLRVGLLVPGGLVLYGACVALASRGEARAVIERWRAARRRATP